MQRLLVYLFLLGAAVLTFILLLPVFIALLVLLAGVVLFFMAAPLLARLPWFRNWIRVERHGPFRGVRFSRGGFATYRSQSDVIDVEARVVAVEEREEPEETKRLEEPRQRRDEA